MKFLKMLGEIALELVLSLVMFLIGWGILSLFGVELTLESDPELAMLIGSLIFLLPFIIFVFVVHNFKNKR